MIRNTTMYKICIGEKKFPIITYFPVTYFTNVFGVDSVYSP